MWLCAALIWQITTPNFPTPIPCWSTPEKSVAGDSGGLFLRLYSAKTFWNKLVTNQAILDNAA